MNEYVDINSLYPVVMKSLTDYDKLDVFNYQRIMNNLNKNHEFWINRKKNDYNSNLISQLKFNIEECIYQTNAYKIFESYKGWMESFCLFQNYLGKSPYCKSKNWLKKCPCIFEKQFYVNGIML